MSKAELDETEMDGEAEVPYVPRHQRPEAIAAQQQMEDAHWNILKLLSYPRCGGELREVSTRVYQRGALRFLYSTGYVDWGWCGEDIHLTAAGWAVLDERGDPVSGLPSE